MAGPSETDDARRRRLAAALRENLKRRKAQGRAQRDSGGATGEAGAETTPSENGPVVPGPFDARKA